MLCYPPFASMIRLVIRGPVEAVVAEFADYIAQRIAAALSSRHTPCAVSPDSPSEPEELAKTDGTRGVLATGTRILGPAPCPFARLKGRYRFQIQIHGPEGEPLRAAVRQATAELEPPEDVQWIVDVDPVEML
jgi:primosomal protein N' (replication factor Y) (superfamily II helicase)